MKILMVDDNLEIIEIIKENLSLDFDFPIILKDNPKDALETVLNDEKIELVFSDFNMNDSDMDGVDLCHKIVNNTNASCFIVSGETIGEGIEKIEQSQFIHIPKPVGVDQLSEVIKKFTESF